MVQSNAPLRWRSLCIGGALGIAIIVLFNWTQPFAASRSDFNEYYDYRQDVVNVTFRNYEDNATRKTGALSYLMYTSAGVSTENDIEGAKFINAKPVYFPPMERKWGNDNLNGVAWKAAAIHDLDGSVGGVPEFLHSPQRRPQRQHRHRRERLRDQARLERCGVQGGYRTPEFCSRRRRSGRRSWKSRWCRCWRGSRGSRSWWSRRCCSHNRGCWWSRWWSCSAAGRSQPQWQGVQL